MAGFLSDIGNFVDQAGTALHLPEMGLSEAIAGSPTTNTYNYQAAQGNAYGPVNPGYYQTQNTFGLGSSPQPIGNPSSGVQGSAPVSASFGGGSSGGGGGPANNYPGQAATGMTEAQYAQDQAFRSQQQQAAQDAYNAQNSALNTQYDQSAANLQNQLPYLQQQRDSSLGSLDQAYTDAQNQTNNARTSAQTNTEQQINQAGDVAHQTQNQNRNILRALGIGGGTYAAELLSKPLNAYDQQRGQLNTALQQRNQQLDDFLNSQAKSHAQAVGDLQNNYANLVGKIQSDLRFNDRQRNDALQAANAALSQNLAQIQQSMMNYQNQVQLQKQDYSNKLGQLLAYQDPTYAKQAFQNTLLSNSGFGQQQGVNIINPQKKDQLTGLSAQ